jgi:hypothetical protein
MPSLKELNCSIELSDDQEPLQELGTVYGDAFVETFIPVPKKQRTFTVHLSSRDFIAPGIAMYVFIDGVYQCNRNRQNMKLRKPLDRRSLVDFKVRQKEEKLKDGSMVAREWTFEKLDHGSIHSSLHRWHTEYVQHQQMVHRTHAHRTSSKTSGASKSWSYAALALEMPKLLRT